MTNPQVTRRTFHKIALALMASGGGSGLAEASVPNGSSARKFLNRLTFGATEKSVQEFEAQGLSAWLEQQLLMPATPNEVEQRLAKATLPIEYGADRDDAGHNWPARKEVIPLNYLSATGEKLYPLTDFEKHGMSYEERIRPAREVQVANLIRAVHSEAQLREVLTQFWHDHFSVNSMRDQTTAAYFPLYDKVMRENAFGNFRAFLGEVARQPSMLYYLNNTESRASPANENFARELMELHTLGAMNYVNDATTVWSEVPGAKQGLSEAYIDQDVYEAARAFTGWSVGDGHYITDGENAPLSGAFHYIDGWHDPYQKRILGVEFGANAGPMDDGEKLLDILAAHEGTARFICTKLCRRLLADAPPADLVKRAAEHWRKNVNAPDQIASTIKLIVSSQEFSKMPPQKLKRPFEFMVSCLRAADAEVTSPRGDFLSLLARAGWFQHEFRPPTGHPDVSSAWANTNVLAVTIEIAQTVLQEWGQITAYDSNTLVPAEVKTVAEAIDLISQKFLGTKPGDDSRKLILAALENDDAATLPEAAGDRDWALKSLAGLVVLNPQFLYR
jgi:uncharacterized protein (DUF1800 family)